MRVRSPRSSKKSDHCLHLRGDQKRHPTYAATTAFFGILVGFPEIEPVVPRITAAFPKVALQSFGVETQFEFVHHEREHIELECDLDEPGTNWSQATIDLVVTGYFDLWKQYLTGQSPIKIQKYRELSNESGRSVKSIERKFQNISAVLERLGLPWIPGLAPLRHYQGLLVEAVALRIAEIWNFEPVSNAEPNGLADSPILFPEQAPKIEGPVQTTNEKLARLAKKFDPALRDLRNRKTGLLGERWVFNSEIVRLEQVGRSDLAKKVKWVSQEDGDGAGFDILSFEPNGEERFLEVKTTVGHRRTPFFLSCNERDFAEEAPKNFRIFRLFEAARTPRAFLIAPPLDSALILEPSVYRASFG